MFIVWIWNPAAEMVNYQEAAIAALWGMKAMRCCSAINIVSLIIPTAIQKRWVNLLTLKMSCADCPRCLHSTASRVVLFLTLILTSSQQWTRFCLHSRNSSISCCRNSMRIDLHQTDPSRFVYFWFCVTTCVREPTSVRSQFVTEEKMRFINLSPCLLPVNVSRHVRIFQP